MGLIVVSLPVVPLTPVFRPGIAPAAPATAAAKAQELPDHSTFTRVLEHDLHGTLVDYAALKAEPAELETYLSELGATPVAVLEQASRAEQLAFWINAYNACALKLVIDHYPIRGAGFPKSLIRSLKGVPANSIRQISDTWKRKFCAVGGEPRALDEIEHEIIRPMGEPRIHFAVNCAARSCPVLAPAAYTPDALDQQLDMAVRRFIENPEHYRLERGPDAALYLNKVLDWYAEDFGGTEGVVDFLLRYLPRDDAEFVRQHRPVTVRHVDYDWTLNDTAVFGEGRP